MSTQETFLSTHFDFGNLSMITGFEYNGNHQASNYYQTSKFIRRAFGLFSTRPNGLNAYQLMWRT